MTNYEKYRGKCKELVDEAIRQDPTLVAVRGYYYDPEYGREQHWWCRKVDGTIYDPSALQFPSEGRGVYEEFDGMCECEQCGTRVPEDKTVFYGHHAYCSTRCNLIHVGLEDYC